MITVHYSSRVLSRCVTHHTTVESPTVCANGVRKTHAHIHVYGLSIRKPTFHFNKPCSGSAIQGHLQGSDSIIPPFTTGGKHFHGEWFCLNRLPSQIIQFPLI